MRESMIDSTFPLVDNHRHLSGNVRLETILALGREHDIPLPADTVESLRPHAQVIAPQPGLMDFIAKFEWAVKVLADYDACRRIAYENMEDARREGLAYLELRFSPWFMAEPHGLDPAGVVEAVVDGARAGTRDFGVGVGLIGVLSRTYGPALVTRELDALLHAAVDLVALDLAGDEAGQPGELFVAHMQRGREAGLHITVHAGEAAGPESVWQAIDALGAERIGHGVRAVEDPALLDALVERGIGVEQSLTSNVQTSTVSSYAAHPLRRFLEHGVRVSINTDDPGISGIDLAHEYNVAAPAAGLTREQIRQAQRNALAIAFLSEEEKARLTLQAQLKP